MNTADELRRVVRACGSYFMTAGLFSLAINLLYLASPLYMLQVYDRVISSASISTLVMLTIALLIALLALAGLDVVRARILARAGIRLEKLLAGRVMGAIFAAAGRGENTGAQPLRDFDNVRLFLSGPGINALFDLPWAPVYIAVIFLLHPWLGAFALGCALLLMLTAIAGEQFARKPLAEAGTASNVTYRFAESSLRNWEAVQAMGMLPGLLARWGRDRGRMVGLHGRAADRIGASAGLTRFLRLAMQSLMLGLGAYLVIERQTTVGAMFAASILLARALQPVELLVGAWRSVAAARTAWQRLRALLRANPEPAERLALPRPAGRLDVEGVSYVPRGTQRPIIARVAFSLDAGQALGMVGPSGAGKSTLARLLVGVLPPAAGVVRLDGADIAKWPRDAIGPWIGYLPQDVELFADTVASNISRFRAGDDAAVIAAAKAAGVHDAILALPEGYDTQIGEGGAVLSGGMRQRIGLARAVYGTPSLVVLDEPNSSLDFEGEAALTACLRQLKARGTTVVIVSHRPSTLGIVDRVLVLKGGTVAAFGPREEVLRQFTRPARVATAEAS